jgi:Ca2+-binding RTX toxin-like protein
MATFTGTSAANHIVGTTAADLIRGYGGNDLLEGGADVDRIYGGGGNDTLNGGTGNDILTGGAGSDVFLFSAGDGRDVITDLRIGDSVKINGYASAQSVTQAGTNVVVTFSASDTITFSNATIATVQAALQFGSGGGGGTTGGTITGTANNDVLNGTAGNDTIYGLGGYDVIHGGGGSDRIYGGLSGDGLYGGAGADVFAYTSAAEGPLYGLMYTEWDSIYDFQSIDKIDLSAIDANTLVAGNQAFHFAGYLDAGENAPDHSAGTLYIRGSGEYADIIAFTNDDTTPDFFLEIVQGGGQGHLAAANLIL